MANQRKAQERAARNAALKEAERRQAKRGMIIRVVAIAASLVLIAGVIFLISQNQGDDGSGLDPEAGASDYGFTVGDKDAPHTLVIYEDFLCPVCGALEHETEADLKQLADDGKVFIDYRPFVLLDNFGSYSADATNAFAVVQKESGDDVAFEFHKLLFENQPPEDSESFPGADELIDLAVEAGADEADVRPGIEDNAESAWVDGATSEATDDVGVEGTPTIYLDGERYTLKGDDMAEAADNLIADVS